MGFWSPLYDEDKRYVTCESCGRRMNRDYDSDGRWDGETYYCKYCIEKEENEDDDD